MDLRKITEGLNERVADGKFLPGKIILFDFGPDGLVRIDGTSEPAAVSNEDGEADCRVKVSMPDFVDIATGKKNAQMAFMTGKVKVTGDLGVAMQLGRILG